MSSHVELSVAKKNFEGASFVALHAAHATLQMMGAKNVWIELHIVTDKEMQRISKRTRNKDHATNVLSFEAESFPRGDVRKGKFLGEVYLAPDFIFRKKQDIELLAVHGTLHLLGYTHETKRDTIVMERIEDTILSKIQKS